MQTVDEILKSRAENAEKVHDVARARLARAEAELERLEQQRQEGRPRPRGAADPEYERLVLDAELRGARRDVERTSEEVQHASAVLALDSKQTAACDAFDAAAAAADGIRRKASDALAAAIRTIAGLQQPLRQACAAEVAAWAALPDVIRVALSAPSGAWLAEEPRELLMVIERAVGILRATDPQIAEPPAMISKLTARRP